MSQHLKEFARKLVEISLDQSGRPSEERVAAVLAALSENPPAQYRALLRQYYRYLEVALRASQVRLEYAGPEPKEAAAQILEQMQRQYGRELSLKLENNEALLGGLRVSVGDDVYDSSVVTRLEQLRSASLV